MRVTFSLLIISFVLLSGCYQRKTTPSYTYDESSLEGIREQLGVITSDKVYTNEEEEEED